MQPTDTPAPPSSWYARTPFFYGWTVVGAAFFTNLIATGVQLWALAVMVVPMLEDLPGWQRGDVYGALTVRFLITAALTPFVGHYIDRRYGATIMMIVGGALAAISTAAIATVHEPWEFMLWFGVLGGIAGPGAAFLVTGAIIPKWFVRKRGKALALSTMGTGAAALLMPPFVAMAVSAVGWRDTWVLLGIATIAITVPLSLLIRRQPEDVGLLPDGVARPAADDSSPAPSDEYSYTRAAAIRLPRTWLMMAAMTLASMSLLGVPANLVPMLRDRGMGLELASLGLTTYGLFSVLARFGWGTVADRTHVRTALMALAVYGAAVTALFVVVGSTTQVLFVLAGATGFAVGGVVVLNPVLWPTYLGRRHLGAIMGVVMPVTSLGGATGPLMMAKVYDWTGSYEIGLLILSGAWAVSGVAMYFARPTPRPAPQPAPLPST